MSGEVAWDDSSTQQSWMRAWRIALTAALVGLLFVMVAVVWLLTGPTTPTTAKRAHVSWLPLIVLLVGLVALGYGLRYLVLLARTQSVLRRYPWKQTVATVELVSDWYRREPQTVLILRDEPATPILQPGYSTVRRANPDGTALLQVIIAGSAAAVFGAGLRFPRRARLVTRDRRRARVLKSSYRVPRG